ncbi:DUF6350 family protein [Microbacterium telephonicum]|uniref:Uncharacterized protein n=1 Tax=Microbacterium telephonicum TaxID=1714841 RepID=A0A498BYJ7_9MICO|nr:DUF6350 family protein [Microbacterium telephonicum]RLK47867.1 hypothetical protein C7474_2466 [Microbacterium telephonicum]
MNRLLVVILAAFDAAIAAAVGLAAALAPLTLLWVFGFGGGADWGLLWPASARIWQFGLLVPVQVDLPDAYLVSAGVPVEGAAFLLSLSPLAFAVFTALFAARSGARAAHSGAGLIGVLSGGVVFAALASLVTLSAHAPVAAVETWQAILLPVLVYALPAAAGALVTAWREGDDGVVDAVHDLADDSELWRGAVPAAARGLAAALVGMIGVGAAVLAVALAVGGGDVVALFESAHVDLVGAVAIGLAQVAYLPTLVVWGLSFAAGPGLLLGDGATVSAAGTDVGVLPAIPVLGIVPEDPSQWLLLLAVVVVAVGAFAGWIARRRLVDEQTDAVATRLAVLGILVVGAGGAAALLAVVASGSIGPGRLAVVGTQPGPLALAVGAEIAVGAAITLFGLRASTRERGDDVDRYDTMPDSDVALVPTVVAGGAATSLPQPDGGWSSATGNARSVPVVDVDMQATEEIAPIAFLSDDAEPDTAPTASADPPAPDDNLTEPLDLDDPTAPPR